MQAALHSLVEVRPTGPWSSMPFSQVWGLSPRKGWGWLGVQAPRRRCACRWLTWAQRLRVPRALGLQRCSLLLWKVGIHSLGLFSSLHLSKRTCGHSRRRI